MVVKMKDPVRNEGEITTIDELDKRGLIDFKEVKNFWSGRKHSTKYFADITGTTSGWEIGKLAYLSRTAENIEEELNSQRGKEGILEREYSDYLDRMEEGYKK